MRRRRIREALEKIGGPRRLSIEALKDSVQRFPRGAHAVTLEAMRFLMALPLAVAAALAVATGAQADTTHVVTPGESLTSVAADDGVSINALAGANRLKPNARLIAGAILRIPPRGTGYRAGDAPRAAAAPAPARSYTVRRGDTLSGLAARAGVSVNSLARLNRISPHALLITGATIKLPATPAASRPAPATHGYRVRPGDTLSGVAAASRVSTAYLARLNHLSPHAFLIAGATITVPGTAPAPVAATPTTHPYVVQPGDTLSAVAARAGVSDGELAHLNHVSPHAFLIAGATMTVPGTPASQGGPPYPTTELVSSTEIERVAAENGVPASLATAIAWQESGFNNDRVSSADARGVMQILPGTWQWIQSTLTSGVPLAPASAIDNVRAGVLYLHDLLLLTGGDVHLAVAGYIQGLRSVREHGMYAETRQYVRDVLALRRRFD
jgi:LysM repeat protein